MYFHLPWYCFIIFGSIYGTTNSQPVFFPVSYRDLLMIYRTSSASTSHLVAI
ncbi:hypothetical protein BX070DRAFT_228761 [Coemansia spiralis]|nr:hypothetical protein BX070DRAFT_228761 [Coemansia spiralis]